jgi:hypothetical protein
VKDDAIPIEWGGWRLEGKLLVKPRRSWLRESEAKIMAVLLRLKGKYILSVDLHAASSGAGSGSLQTMRTKVSTLRDVIGRKSVFLSRDYGYRLLRADDGHGNTRDPLDELIENLTNALAAAKRMKHTKDLEKARHAAD